LSIYKSEWSKLTTHKDSKSFRQCIALQFKLKASENKSNINKESLNSNKQVNISRVPSSITLRLNKKVLEKSKFYKHNVNSSPTATQNGWSYAQAFKSYIKNIMKIKGNIPNLSTKKIEKVHKILNKPKKDKSKLNMTIKRLLRKQVIVLMSLVNSERFIVLYNKHVSNINRCHMQVHLSRNYIPTVILSPNYTSPPSTAEILLFTSVFHNRVTSISISTLKPLSISYNIQLYIRLVVIC